MDDKLFKELKKKLEDKKKRIEKELNEIAKKDPHMKGDYDTRFPDFGAHQSSDENALEVAAYQNTLPIEYALELRLQKINKVLEKIEKGTYGICEKCGGSISDKRLKILPEAVSCMKCNKKK